MAAIKVRDERYGLLSGVPEGASMPHRRAAPSRRLVLHYMWYILHGFEKQFAS